MQLINPPDVRLQSVVKIFPFKSLKCLEVRTLSLPFLHHLVRLILWWFLHDPHVSLCLSSFAS